MAAKPPQKSPANDVAVCVILIAGTPIISGSPNNIRPRQRWTTMLAAKRQVMVNATHREIDGINAVDLRVKGGTSIPSALAVNKRMYVISSGNADGPIP